MKVSYVILQYNLYEKTIKCIEHIERNTKIDYQVVVVDNCSTNEAYSIVRQHYQHHSHVTVIQTYCNLGFARGNNYGVDYVTQHHDYDWIIIMNNDIYLNTPLTEQVLNLPYEVIGPDIFRVDTEEHQNPLPIIKYSNFYIFYMTMIYRVYLILNTLYLDYYLHKLAIYCLTCLNKRQAKKQKLVPVKEAVIGKVHGSVILFKKSFIDRYSAPFHPSTFMYLEEDFLSLRCQRANIAMYYQPAIQFIHDHSSTVDSISKNAHQKSRYVYKNNIKSLVAFRKYFNSDED